MCGNLSIFYNLFGKVVYIIKDHISWDTDVPTYLSDISVVSIQQSSNLLLISIFSVPHISRCWSDIDMRNELSFTKTIGYWALPISVVTFLWAKTFYETDDERYRLDSMSILGTFYPYQYRTKMGTSGRYR